LKDNEDDHGHQPGQPCEFGVCNVDKRHRQEPQDCGEHGEIGIGLAVVSDGFVIDRVSIDRELATE
jgi:hypothetical protein